MTTEKPRDPGFTPPDVEPLAFEQAFRPTDELTVGDFWRWVSATSSSTSSGACWRSSS